MKLKNILPLRGITLIALLSFLALPTLMAQSDEGVFTVVEEMPEFPGGDAELLKFINQNVQYPKSAQENGIEGRVVITFTVEKDGSINDIQVVRGIDPALDKEAVRVTGIMPKWRPGKQKGENVRVKYTLPIVFRLQSKSNQLNVLPEITVVAFTNTKESNSIEKIFTEVDNMPEFPGGESELLKFVNKSVKYPAVAQENGVQGRVTVGFIIEKDGNITNIYIEQGIDKSLNDEAMRVIDIMPKWIPGKKDGETVRVKHTLPIVFRLQ